jgi:hypothetical protein
MLAGLLLIANSVVAQPVVTVTDRPDFTAVTQAVAVYFAGFKDCRPGDLLNQSQVAGALDAVEAAGWAMPDGQSIIKLAPADDSFLVQVLSTASGRRFMRKIAKYPGAYSRLDRLSAIPDGKQLIKRLISTKGGADLIQYMATTSGGRKLGSMMARAQHGVDLNQPTGRIYTADELLAALKVAYDRSALPAK